MTWPEQRLSDFCRFRHGGTPSKARADFWGGDIPWVSPKDMRQGVLRETEDHITRNAVDEDGALLVPPKSILIVVRSGILVRAVPVALTAVEVAFNQDMKSIQVDARVAMPEFVYWFLHSRESAILANGVKRGATVHSIQSGFIEALAIPLPGLCEQRRIVELLEQADALRRKRAEADALAERILPALFRRMFGDPATNPKGWAKQPLGQVTEIDAPMVDPRQPEYLDLPHIGPDKIEGKTGRLLRAQTAREEQLISGKFLFDERHVLYSKIRPYLRKVALPTGRGLCSADMYPVTPIDSAMTREFLWALLLGEAFTNFAAEHSGRANIPKLNRDQFSAFQCPVPPLEQQQRFSKRVRELQSIDANQQASRGQLEALFVTMLHHAFTGELTAKWREAHLKELLPEMEQQAKLLNLGGGPE